jgi:hypothetical protein
LTSRRAVLNLPKGIVLARYLPRRATFETTAAKPCIFITNATVDAQE